MKRSLALVLALSLVLTMSLSFASADELQMSDVPGMTAPGVLPIVTEPTELVVGIPQSALVTDYDDNWMTTFFEEKSGIDLVFDIYPGAETGTYIDLMFSTGNDLPDVLAYGGGMNFATTYGEQGYLQSMKKYFDPETGYAGFFYNTSYMTEDRIKNYLTSLTSPDGEIYTFGFYSESAGSMPMNQTYINRLWLDKLGLEVPTTADEFYNVLCAFRDNDMDGDGDPTNEIPLLASDDAFNSSVASLIINMFTYYNEEEILAVKDSVVYAPFVTDEWQQAMIYMNKLGTEGLISPLCFTTTYQDVAQMTDTVDPEHAIIGVLMGQPVQIMPEKSSLLAYDYLPVMTGPEGASYSPVRAVAGTPCAYITCDCEIPEIAFRFFDFWTDRRYSRIPKDGPYGDNWICRDDDPELFDSMYPAASQTYTMMGIKPFWGYNEGGYNGWSEANNWMWHIHFCNMRTFEVNAEGTTGADFVNNWEEAWDKQDANKLYEYISASFVAENLMTKDHVPAEVYANPIYSVDELDQFSDTMNSTSTYVKEMIASFTTGAKDPVNDWDEYVASLESIGLEDYIALAQKVYDRSH